MADIFDKVRTDPHLRKRNRLEREEFPVRVGVEVMGLPVTPCWKCDALIEGGFALGHWDVDGIWKVRHRICPGKTA